MGVTHRRLGGLQCVRMVLQAHRQQIDEMGAHQRAHIGVMRHVAVPHHQAEIIAEKSPHAFLGAI